MTDRIEEEDGDGRQRQSTSALRATPTRRRQKRMSHSPYPASSPRTPNRGTASSLVTAQKQPKSPQSPSMRALSTIVGILSPFGSSRQAKTSAAFGTPTQADDEGQDEGEDEAAHSDTNNEGEEPGEGMDVDQSIYPAIPGLPSPILSPQPEQEPAPPPPRQSFFSSSVFAAPRHSTPSKMGFGALAASASQQVLPPSAPVFTFGNSALTPEAAALPLPSYPRPSARSHLSSPLARNYDLLARFFSEKAEQEAHGEMGSSVASLQAGGEEGGLTEIEVAGCMRLIEESLAQGRSDELDRLRGAALERASLGVASPRYLDSTSPGFMSRSPSLPLGAAAGEMPVGYGLQARPSSSFLSPAYSRSQDALVNQSLATTFASVSAPAKRRHRPLYLGPGQGASAASSLLQRNKQMYQQRRSVLSRPAHTSRPMAAPSWQQREEYDDEDRDASGSNAKRRRVREDEADGPQAKSLTVSQSTPSVYLNTSPHTPSPTVREEAAATPSRTATADAMLSILSAGPAIPVRRSVPGGKPSPAEDPSAARSDIVNPYQTRSRPSKRPSVAMGLAAKEKERLKEERERKYRLAEDAQRKSKESTLEMIERTASSQGSKRGGRRIRADDYEAEEREKQEGRALEQERMAAARQVEADRLAKAEAEKQAEKRAKEESAARVEAEEKRKQANAEERRQKTEDEERRQSAATSEERKRKTEEVKKRLDQLASQTATSTPTATDPPLAAPAPRKSFTFGSSFAPKKPSPLSQANNMAPDSPSSASEASEKGASNPFAFAPPSNGVKTDSMGNGSSKAPTSLQSGAKNARQEAIEIASTSLPKFDFAVSIVTPPTTSDNEPRKAAKAKEVSQLPTFDLVSPVTATPALSSSGPSSGSSTPSFSFATSAPAPTAQQNIHVPQQTVAAEPSPPSNAASESKSTDSNISALLSGTGEGEEDEDCLHEVRCKMWNLKEGKWADLGIGLFKVKKNKSNGKKRVLVRNAGNGKVVVNFRLTEGFKPIKDKNIVSFLGFDGDGKPTNYRCKVKTDDGAGELTAVLEREAR